MRFTSRLVPRHGVSLSLCQPEQPPAERLRVITMLNIHVCPVEVLQSCLQIECKQTPAVYFTYKVCSFRVLESQLVLCGLSGVSCGLTGWTTPHSASGASTAP